MKIFVADSNNGLRQTCVDNDIGILSSPSYYRKPWDNLDYILDNGAYICWNHGLDWNEEAFYKTVNKLKTQNVTPYFVVIPDIVTGGLKSLEFSMNHIQNLPEWKKYLPVQDGMEPSDISKEIINQIDGLFIGGSVEWKWKTAQNWINRAHQNQIKCHIGRVGTKIDYWKSYHLGADSVDGSNPSRNKKMNIPIEFQAWVKEQSSLGSFSVK